MIFFAKCAPCGAAWRYITPPDRPMDLLAAIAVMEKGLCPTCRNNGSKGPINWRFTFGGDREATTGQVRPKERPAQQAPTGEGATENDGRADRARGTGNQH